MTENENWIPIDERLPEVDEKGWSRLILISSSNYSRPTIGTYYQEKDGSGTFLDSDYLTPLKNKGIIVNAWMALPRNYSEGEEE